MVWAKHTIDYGIIGFLVLLSVVSLGITIERWLSMRSVKVAERVVVLRA